MHRIKQKRLDRHTLRMRASQFNNICLRICSNSVYVLIHIARRKNKQHLQQMIMKKTEHWIEHNVDRLQWWRNILWKNCIEIEYHHKDISWKWAKVFHIWLALIDCIKQSACILDLWCCASIRISEDVSAPLNLIVVYEMQSKRSLAARLNFILLISSDICWVVNAEQFG